MRRAPVYVLTGADILTIIAFALIAGFFLGRVIP